MSPITRFFERQGQQISAVYLLASATKGRASSGTDVAVLLQKERKDRASFEIDLEEQLQKITEDRVKVRLLNGASLPFCLNVIRTGSVILDRAPNTRAEFQGRILKESFDFYRYRKRYWTEVLQRPRP